MKIVRWLFGALAALVALVLVVFIGARFHDGPLGPIPGGALASGDWGEGETGDWSFAKDVAEIELQLESQSTSRTTWILVRDGQAFIPVSLGYPPGKTWHREAAKDGRAVLRIEGKRFAVTLAKDDDPTLAGFATGEVNRKYGNMPPSDAGVMFFRISSRAR
jgi:hypothetical protein